jgi:hypothetical protein
MSSTPQPQAFVAGTVIASAITLVAAVPTTAAQFCLLNQDPAKSYYITTVGCSYTTSAAAAENVQLFAHVSVGPVTHLASPTAAQGPKALGSGPTAGSLAVVGSAVSITNDGVWHPVGWSSNSGAGTATCSSAVTWYEQ